MGRLLAAPDKFRGTATAPEVAAAASRAAASFGWETDEAPMADGGEGLLDAVGGDVRHTVVTGPLGEPVSAEWRLVSRDGPPTAVVEMARAAGRALLPRPRGDEPVRATTAGVGELVVAAVDEGAARVVVGVGGSATTDGGWGAVQAIGSRARLGPTELVVACDVRTPFLRAAEIFGPQKGASPEQVAVLGSRLEDLATRYRDELDVDVTVLPGAGAAGGLAGGLAALGARLVPGFDLVADMMGLAERIDGADLVVTGEGRLDATSLEGKVVAGVTRLAAGRAPVLCVVGEADPGVAERLGPSVEVVDLTARYGAGRARSRVVDLVAEVVGAALERRDG